MFGIITLAKSAAVEQKKTSPSIHK